VKKCVVVVLSGSGVGGKGGNRYFEEGDIGAFAGFSSFAGDEHKSRPVVVRGRSHCDSEFGVRGVFPGSVGGWYGGYWASKRELIGSVDIRRDSGDNFEGR
jgi:hypothetical protein